jgi:hypothetical protein
MTKTFHLTDEQMYDLLEPASNAPAQPHLQSCAECQAELTNLRESLANFRGAATNLAAMSAPRHFPIASRITSWFFGPKVWAASFATATAILAVSISVLNPVHGGSGTNTSANSAAQTALATESDDALLDGIQQDLSTSIPPSLEPLAVPAAASETSTQN